MYQAGDDERASRNLLGGVEGVCRLQVILDALEDYEGMMYIRNLRDQSIFSKPIPSAAEFVNRRQEGSAARMERRRDAREPSIATLDPVAPGCHPRSPW